MELKARIDEINSLDLNDIDFINHDSERIVVDEKIVSDFKYTGLNVVDFITTEFYLTGFGEDVG